MTQTQQRATHKQTVHQFSTVMKAITISSIQPLIDQNNIYLTIQQYLPIFQHSEYKTFHKITKLNKIRACQFHYGTMSEPRLLSQTKQCRINRVARVANATGVAYSGAPGNPRLPERIFFYKIMIRYFLN